MNLLYSETFRGPRSILRFSESARLTTSAVPPYVCPLQSTSTSEAPFLGIQELVYYSSPIQLSLTCT